MTRFFYTDPLAAAWMAKHFGMVFRENPPADEGWVDPLFDRRDRYVVCADSLHLLEPVEGDYVDAGGRGAWLVAEDERSRNNDRFLITPYRARQLQARVIQRDGRAFHWPESEAA